MFPVRLRLSIQTTFPTASVDWVPTPFAADRAADRWLQMHLHVCGLAWRLSALFERSLNEGPAPWWFDRIPTDQELIPTDQELIRLLGMLHMLLSFGGSQGVLSSTISQIQHVWVLNEYRRQTSQTSTPWSRQLWYRCPTSYHAHGFLSDDPRKYFIARTISSIGVPWLTPHGYMICNM